MELKTITAAVAVALLAFAGIAFAFPGWQNWQGRQGGIEAYAASHAGTAEQQQFESAVEAGDFAAAKALHDQYGFGGRMFDSLDASSFAKFSQMHSAMESGDFAKAQQLRSELRTGAGLGAGKAAGAGRGPGRGMGGCPHASG